MVLDTLNVNALLGGLFPVPASEVDPLLVGSAVDTIVAANFGLPDVTACLRRLSVWASFIPADERQAFGMNLEALRREFAAADRDVGDEPGTAYNQATTWERCSASIPQGAALPGGWMDPTASDPCDSAGTEHGRPKLFECGRVSLGISATCRLGL